MMPVVVTTVTVAAVIVARVIVVVVRMKQPLASQPLERESQGRPAG